MKTVRDRIKGQPRLPGLTLAAIYLGVYDYTFWLAVGPFDQVKRFVAWKNADTQVQRHPANVRGCIFRKPNFTPVLWIPKLPRTAREHGTLAHEAFHLTYEVASWASIPLGDDSEEAYAHLLGALVTGILVKIRGNK